MSHPLPSAIAAYVHASNAHSPDLLVECFSPLAVVTDEGHSYRGVEGIREWAAKTLAAYAPMMEVTGVEAQGNETVATCQVTGTFPGSPVQLRFSFTLEGDTVAALVIRA